MPRAEIRPAAEYGRAARALYFLSCSGPLVNAHVHVHTCTVRSQEEDIQQCCITSMVYRIVSSEFVAHDMVYMYSTFMLHMRVSINVGLHGNTCV